MFQYIYGVAEVARVRSGIEDADVRAIADQAQRVHAALTEGDVEGRPEEARIAPLRYHDVVLCGRELGDDLGSLGAHERVRRGHLKLRVAPQGVIGQIDDRLVRGTGTRGLAAYHREDPRRRRAPGEATAFPAEG